MKGNPYSLVFGKEPPQMVSRAATISQIVGAFGADDPTQQVFLLTGVRGSGKTVLMTEVCKRLRSDPGWIVVELNPERDMLEALASKLSSENQLARIFKSSKINLSFFGFGLSVGDAAPITDIEVALAKMLASLKKHGKRVLVAVDEAASTPNVRAFASAFQILVRQDLPLFLLMTGLFENVRRLQDEKTLTFLYRAPRLETGPLNIGAVADNYRRNFALDYDRALHMAKLTKGYPFAFQVLGYFAWEHGGLGEATLADYKQYLDDYAYEKIWSELSRNDRKLAYGIARADSRKVAQVRELVGWDTNQFNPYRDRLIK
ncbi:MAG: ATP-binding protein [Eggerthellaceae bacterium]|nr:ATP-binding protein [Eggerthellaceae bacterium]